MMNRREGVQQKMLCVTLESLMPEQHFLRDLDRLVDFDFIYEKIDALYSRTGRPSIDPVVIVKMMLLGYLYGIDSERRLEREVQVNLAFRWFLGIDLDEPVPDHSTISQLRRRKFNGTNLFEEIFDEVVRLCMARGLITRKLLLTDSTHVRANARNNLYETVTVDDEPSAYIRRLNEQAVAEGLLPEDYEEKPPTKQKEIRVSITDPDSGYMHRPGKPNGFYYLSHQTCDAEYGMITDVLVTPGNASDRSVHSQRIQYQIDKFGFQTEAVCADKGYDSSEIDADMLARGIRTYIPRQASGSEAGRFQTSDYQYDEKTDTYRCPAGCILKYTAYNPRTGGKEYCCSVTDCRGCALRAKCISQRSIRKLIFRGLNTSASKAQRQNNTEPEFYAALRLRQIWCEGNFSHQKANHNLQRTRKRGLGKAAEHCLLSATAFNLKRMVKLLRGLPPRILYNLLAPSRHLIFTRLLLFPSGLSTAPYIAVLIGGNSFKWKCIERDDELISMLIQLESDFWQHIQDGTPPPLDGSAASAKFLAERFANSRPSSHIDLPDKAVDLLRQYDEACEQLEAITEQKQLAENLLKEMMGENEIGTAGNRIITWKNMSQERLDSKTLKAEHPALYKKYANKTSFRRFSIKAAA